MPYEVIYGRSPVLPEDVLLGVNEQNNLRDVTNPADYAEELKIVLREIYRQVNQELHITREIMQKQYNKNINVHNHTVGQYVWLKKKFYKTGENRKLSPRRTGPWKIIEILPNGVNFKIRNESSGITQIVHHDRLTPLKISLTNDPVIITNHPSADGWSSAESSSEEESILSEVLSDTDEIVNEGGFASRYPTRNRRPRVIDGAIPWSAIDK